MAVIKANEVKLPYLHKNKDIIIGLNTLGLRNSGEHIYQRMLIGLNNVTQRIRYYTFYCWLLKRYYDSRMVSGAEKHNFRRFLRRSEYLLALIDAIKPDDSGGVPGITYANNAVSNNPDGPFDIASAADTTDKSYWSNPGGVLYQYYYASLLELGVIGTLHADESLPQITTMTEADNYIDGNSLADALQSDVSTDAQELFLNCVSKGNVSREELLRLREEFNMKQFSNAPTEKDLLIRLLLQQDSPMELENSTYYRRESIKYALQYAAGGDDGKTWTNFTKYLFDQYYSVKENAALGWFDYYVNNKFQYEVTVIFNHILKVLEKGACPVPQLVEQMAEELTSVYSSNDAAGVLEELGENNDNGAEEAHIKAFRELLLLAKSTKDVHPVTSDLFCNKQIYNFYEFRAELFNSGKSLKEFARWMLEDVIIYRHYALAFRKQLQSGQATHKFVIDNNVMYFVNQYTPSDEAPRLDSLIDFLGDLQLIDGSSITEAGRELLKELEA